MEDITYNVKVFSSELEFERITSFEKWEIDNDFIRFKCIVNGIDGNDLILRKDQIEWIVRDVK